MNKNMNKIIIVDFDNTLAIHKNGTEASKIMHAMPNTRLINKLNGLYKLGYNIHIYTARGHLSTSSRNEAKEKYEKIIVDWLKKNNVSFDLLSFDKPLGVIYIDDLSIRPDEIDKIDEILKE